MLSEVNNKQVESVYAPTEERADVDQSVLWAYLTARRPDLVQGLSQRDMRLKRISGGQSNPTYFLDLGQLALVLRKAPSGRALPAAHAVEREFRVMTALADSGVPVPRMVLLEEDPEILGARFYLMARLDGEVVHDARLLSHTPEQRGAIYVEKARILARLHDVDWKACGLEGYGRTGPFFARQIHRWTRQWELSKTREIPEIDQLAAWLREHDDRDETSTIVHGDFRVGNLMLHCRQPRVIGVLDWELSTLGHPLADLAHAACMWHVKPEEYGGLLGCGPRKLGIPDRHQFEEEYLEAANRSAGLTDFHHAFALFRMAVIFEGIAARAKDGTAASENARAVGDLSVVLARRAANIAEGIWPVD